SVETVIGSSAEWLSGPPWSARFRPAGLDAGAPRGAGARRPEPVRESGEAATSHGQTPHV
ncbi:MAG: hypothetical protein ACRELT_14660, partial [Longimicrobiales bacterium]